MGPANRNRDLVEYSIMSDFAERKKARGVFVWKILGVRKFEWSSTIARKEGNSPEEFLPSASGQPNYSLITA